MSVHPQDLSLREQADAVSAGELDATELLEATLARIDERNPAINAIVDRFASEAAGMLSEAPDGPLHGVPVAVKDQFALPWRAPRDGAAPVNLYGVGMGESGIYRRLRDAGAVIVGVTNMHELGLGSTGHLSAYGPAGNPWDPTRCAGGSSGGSAASVAARMVAGAVGTDGGGSIRFPSAYCGVTGLKLTWGQIPIDGFTHGHLTVGTAGPICRDASDARLLAEALLARPLEARPDARLRLGIPRAQLWNDLDSEVAEACARAVDELRGAGLEAEEVSLDGAEYVVIATALLVSMEGGPSIQPEALAEVTPQLSPIIRALGKYQLLTPAVVLLKAERVRALLRRSLARAFQTVDLLAWPSLPAPAPEISDPTVRLPSGVHPADYANVRFGGIANLTGAPAVSVPCGLTRSGLPIGLQLLCPWGADARALDVAELLERATGRRHVEAAPPLAETATARA